MINTLYEIVFTNERLNDSFNFCFLGVVFSMITDYKMFYAGSLINKIKGNNNVNVAEF